MAEAPRTQYWERSLADVAIPGAVLAGMILFILFAFDALTVLSGTACVVGVVGGLCLAVPTVLVWIDGSTLARRSRRSVLTMRVDDINTVALDWVINVGDVLVIRAGTEAMRVRDFSPRSEEFRRALGSALRGTDVRLGAKERKLLFLD